MKSTLLLLTALIGIGFWGRFGANKPSKPTTSASYDSSLNYFKPKPEKKATRAKGFKY